MPTLFADKTIGIDAPASAVWEVLTKPDEANRWARDFASMTIESDWTMGSPVLWKKDDGTTAVEGTVTALKPNELLRFTVADTSNPERAMMSEGDGITFELREQNGKTTLRVLHGDFSVLKDGETYRDMTSQMWGRALPKLKERAERA